MFAGTYTALVTPFHKGRVDEGAYKKLIYDQVRGGVDGIVPVGTTGESPSLGFDEHIWVIELAVQAAKGRVKILAGTGANSTTEAIHLTRAAEAAGVDGSLQVAPYYNKPSQEGLFQHFKKIARATRLPIILYSIPGRCNIAIEVPTVQRLAKACKNIVGIKEAGGDADRVSRLRAALGQRFTILSGDDALTLPFMAVGAEGVISVASNIIPRQIAKMVNAFATGNSAAALRLHQKYYPMFKDLFIETNPVPAKAALAMQGKCTEEYRLPLCKMSASNRAQLAKTLKACGVLKK
ncbi:MAG: 4-hydroxy-tetrahydrodipicolinate synthase [Verrucomicrobiota bacterium]|jgi:4-hydroxy-tetrahydrodipicolinate synthase|nr:4-hydroxy-tetrahydrodipicolinate synthase [Verrucomicrobiota bacterium]MDP7176961.1 4-hydroxy-tetrahydrodipicolinate synthase [Verrucomicrobiota bacterium]MDP7291208.1 4-hydroxy-tetrahydrodipicolinate synthase [Verrucomicrobiota bacterium]HJN83621.1 4-hydroxy-tetrahydrodipicolinate synthase [Verrucomicrobiota bacterium]|tara:strand:+ start:6207 stop:7088 length:882 start_codon:yes stop_codon:yes gene_type:complete